MAKEIDKVLKLQVRGGAANPSPPVGPALGAAGVNIMEFCKQFNARTQDKPGKVLPVVISVYKDKSFDFVIKTPPAAVQLMEAAKAKKGSGEPNRNKVAKRHLGSSKNYCRRQNARLECVHHRICYENGSWYRAFNGIHCIWGNSV